MYRRRGAAWEVFLAHMGGPYWVNKDLGSWSIPKGEYEEGEAPLDAAKREFEEETGFQAAGEFFELGDVRLTSGKLVTAWAFEGDCDPNQLRSNLFTMEWPPKSGRQMEFPEVDRGAWFSLAQAREKLTKAQLPFLDRFMEKVKPS